MKKSKWNMLANFMFNPNFFLKTIFCFLIAHLIVVKEQKMAYTFISSVPRFYDRLVINFLIIYLLASIVHSFTKALDLYYPWEKSYKKRIVYQIFLGIFFPLLPAIILVYIYFNVQEVNIFGSMYFVHYLQNLIVVVIFLNLFQYYQWKKRSQHHIQSKLKPLNDQIKFETHIN